MATNETAALVVALSAQVAKFQKDMDQANQIASKSVKQIEDRFAAVGKVIQDRLGSFANTASSQLGTIGAAVSALGPLGVGAAVGIGALVLAFNALTDTAEKFAEKAKALKELSDTTGLTVSQIQGLGQAAKQAGIDSEKLETFATRFSVAFAQLKATGQGPLFDALIRVGPEMVRQVANAKDLAEAFDLVAKAVVSLTNQEEKNLLVAGAVGQRNVAAVRLLEILGQTGGITGAQQRAAAAGKIIDQAALDKAFETLFKIKQMKDDIEKTKAELFGQTVLDAELKSLEGQALLWKDIAAIWKSLPSLKLPSISTTIGETPTIGERGRIPSSSQDATKEQQLLEFGRERLRQINEQERATQKLNETKQESNPAVELSIQQRLNTARGDSVTQQEELNTKLREQEVQFKINKVPQEDLTRGLNAFTLAQAAARLAAAARLGVATDEQIALQRLAELQAQYNKGLLTTAQLQQGRAVVARDIKAEQEAQQVRLSATPQLTKNLQDANNLLKQFDTISVAAMNSAADAFADVVTGTKKLSDAVRDMVNSIVRDFSRAAFRSIFASIFGGPLQTAGSLLGAPARALGGPVMAGGTYAVGEHGPELFVPQQAGMIVPNEALRRGSGGGPPVINIMNNVDATGADAAAVARLHAGLVALNASIETRVVSGLARHRALVG